MHEVTPRLHSPTKEHFADEDYGPGLSGVVVVLMCRDPQLNFKRRVSFVRKEKVLYMDVMLDLEHMRHLDYEKRKKTIVERLSSEIPATLRKYALEDFDEARFVQDLHSWFAQVGAAPDPRLTAAEKEVLYGLRNRAETGDVEAALTLHGKMSLLGRNALDVLRMPAVRNDLRVQRLMKTELSTRLIDKLRNRKRVDRPLLDEWVAVLEALAAKDDRVAVNELNRFLRVTDPSSPAELMEFFEFGGELGENSGDAICN